LRWALLVRPCPGLRHTQLNPAADSSSAHRCLATFEPAKHRTGVGTRLIMGYGERRRPARVTCVRLGLPQCTCRCIGTHLRSLSSGRKWAETDAHRRTIGTAHGPSRGIRGRGQCTRTLAGANAALGNAVLVQYHRCPCDCDWVLGVMDGASVVLRGQSSAVHTPQGAMTRALLPPQTSGPATHYKPCLDPDDRTARLMALLHLLLTTLQTPPICTAP
jgi:hypothetical protein